VQRFNEHIDFLKAIVGGETRTRGGCDAEALHQRLRAMVPGAHGDALTVQYLRHIMWVRAFDGKGHDRAFVRRFAVKLHPVKPAQPFHGAVAQRRFVLLDGEAIMALKPADGGA
jgi:hypothetical protein